MSYVDLSLNLSSYFVLARICKYVVVTCVLSNCPCLFKMCSTFHLYIGELVHIKAQTLSMFIVTLDFIDITNKPGPFDPRVSVCVFLMAMQQ